MAVVKSVLQALLETNIDSEMGSIAVPNVTYNGPLSQNNPAYFINMCKAIAEGIASGLTIDCVTKDEGTGGEPDVGGAGTSIGIDVDAEYLEEQIYTLLRAYTIADYGASSHPPYPSAGPSNFLKKLSKGIAISIEEHFEICWNYITTHPNVYEGIGEVEKGNYSGLVESAIRGVMISAGTMMGGSGWPRLCQAISTAYVDTIHNQSVSLEDIIITGACAPGLTQVCGIPKSGAGTGILS